MVQLHRWCGGATLITPSCSLGFRCVYSSRGSCAYTRVIAPSKDKNCKAVVNHQGCSGRWSPYPTSPAPTSPAHITQGWAQPEHPGVQAVCSWMTRSRRGPGVLTPAYPSPDDPGDPGSGHSPGTPPGHTTGPHHRATPIATTKATTKVSGLTHVNADRAPALARRPQHKLRVVGVVRRVAPGGKVAVVPVVSHPGQ